MLRRCHVLFAFPLFLAGCPDHPLERPIPEPRQATPVEIPLSLERDLDFLVQVDTSNSMSDEQDLLVQQFPILIFALDQLEGGFPNAHIGVISPDLGAGSYSILTCLTPGGDRGCLESTGAGCMGPSPEPYIDIVNKGGRLEGNIPDVATPIRDVDDTDGDENVTEIIDCNTEVGDGDLDACDISEAFSCIARLGVNGCGFEHQLEAMTRALDKPNTAEGGCNGGFLRPGALLAVLIITDEDDCSAQNPMLFDPADQNIDDPLGPLQSFRCFEFGMDCDQDIPRAGGITLTGCRPLDESDCGDDCWLHPTSRYVNFLRGLRPPGKLLYAAIAGPWEPGDAVRTELDTQMNPAIASSCSGVNIAAPGIRVRAVADALGDDGVYAADPPLNAPVCSNDYSPALEELRERIRSRLMPGCLSSPLIDAGGDLIESADEALCTLEDVQNLNDPENEVRAVLPRCEFAGRDTDDCPLADQGPGAISGDTPCWFLCDSGVFATDDSEESAPCQACVSPACMWQIRVCRDSMCNPATPAPDNTTAVVACVTCNPMVPGCLCGDDVCQSALQENSISCEDDCGG